MAFRKTLWRRIGGFPESVFFGEDTLFDHQARRLTPPVFVNNAKAVYRPQYTFMSACRQLASYSISDGILGVRPARLFRNAGRCIVEVIAVLSLCFIAAPTNKSWSVGWWAAVPLLVIFALEAWFAFHLDWSTIRRTGPRALLARFVFSILVPWIVAANQIRGSHTKKSPPNRQNLE
jgi:hypothetical protein